MGDPLQSRKRKETAGALDSVNGAEDAGQQSCILRALLEFYESPDPVARGFHDSPLGIRESLPDLAYAPSLHSQVTVLFPEFDFADAAHFLNCASRRAAGCYGATKLNTLSANAGEYIYLPRGAGVWAERLSQLRRGAERSTGWRQHKRHLFRSGTDRVGEWRSRTFWWTSTRRVGLVMRTNCYAPRGFAAPFRRPSSRLPVRLAARASR